MSEGYGSYEVDNAARRAREARAARDRAERIKADHQRVAVSYRSEGMDGAIRRLAPDPRAAASTEAVVAWCDTAAAVVEQMRRTVAARRAAAEAREMAHHLASLVATGPIAVPVHEEPAVANPASRSVSAGARVDIVALIEPVVARLDVDADPAERARVTACARAAAGAVGTAGLTLLTDLKVVVDAIGRDVARRRADRERAEGMLRTLDGIVGPDVDDLRHLLERVVAGETTLVSVDEDRVRRVRARAIAEEDDQHVAAHVARVFEDLRYRIDPTSFATELAGGHPAYATIDGAPDHAVEVELGSGGYEYRLVRIGANAAADPARDAELELDLCRAFGAVTARGPDSGVAFTLDGHRAAGETPVRVVDGIGDPARRREQATERERQR